MDQGLGKGRYTYAVYTDGAVSGMSARRPDLTVLDADLVQRLYDMVVFGELDRIGRTMREIHRWVYDTTDIETGRGRRVRVATADGRIDSERTLFGIQLSLMAYMAELEHTLTLERTLSGRELKLAAGGWPGGVTPFWLMLPARGSNEAPTLRSQGVELLEVHRRDASPCPGGRCRAGWCWTRGTCRNPHEPTALKCGPTGRSTPATDPG